MTQDPAGLNIRALRAWLPAHVPGFGSDFTAELLAGGRSNVSYRLTDPAGMSIVLRRPPLGNVMPTAHDMSREYRVMSGMNRVEFPAPHAVALCEDATVIGSSFMVMNFVEGRVIDDAHRAAPLTTTQADEVSAALVDTLARLHTLDPAAAGLADLGRPVGFVERQVTRWGTQWQLTRTRELADIDRLLAWLPGRAANLASPAAGALVHGDYRIDNVILHPSEQRIVAVVDWEMATLGDPLTDLAIALVYWTQATDTVRARVPVAEHITDGPGFWTRAAIVEGYATRTGWDLSSLDTYVALACLKLAVIMESIHKRTLSGQQLGAAGTSDGSMGIAAEALARLGVDTIERGALTALDS